MNLFYIYNTLINKDKRIFISLFFLIFFGVIVELLGIALIIPITQIILFEESSIKSLNFLINNLLSLFQNLSSNKIIVGANLIIIIYLIKSLLLLFIFFYQAKFSWGVQKNISQNLIEKYIFQNYIYHTNKNSSAIIRNIVTETGYFNTILISIAIFYNEIFISLIIGCFLIWYDYQIAITVISIFLISSFLYQFMSKKFLLKLGENRQIYESLRIKIIQEIFGGLKEVKIFKSEKYFINIFKRFNEELAFSGQWQTTLQSLPRLTMEFISILAFCVLLIKGYSEFNNSSQVMSSLVLYAFAAFRVLPSVNRILNSLQTLRYANKVVQLINEEMTLKIPAKRKNIKKKLFQKDLILKSISFKYPNSNSFILKDIKLKISKNKIVGISGESGSGKTTLMNIILGILEPDVGTVNYGNKNINKLGSEWFDIIKFVPQNIFLQDTSLKQNIAFGLDDKDIDEKKIREVINLVNLQDLIDNDGMYKSLGERGVKLSGGQIQRLGIARSLYFDPEIIIMDEPTSALDSKNEKILIEILLLLKKRKKTIVLISHRKSTLSICDSIYNVSKI